MNDELLEMLECLKLNFDSANLEHYQSFLWIIYNSLFLQEDTLDSTIKYKIFETLSSIIDVIALEKSLSINHKNNYAENIEALYREVIPFYLQDEIRLRHRHKRRGC